MVAVKNKLGQDTRSGLARCLELETGPGRQPTAPKGRPSKAQASGLGGRGKRLLLFRPQALKGRDSYAFRMPPFQGLVRGPPSCPRPLAWALLVRPFRAE